MNISNLHLEILDNERKELLNKLLPFTQHFVLSGGTGLALQLGHRLSFDFDFFSQIEISSSLLEILSKNIQIKTVSVNSTDELTFFDENMIKTTFLYYPFPPLFPAISIENGLLIAPMKEIAVQKAYTVGRRGEYRDYFDIYTILEKKSMDLREIIELSEKKYKNIFNSKLFLQQLVYFDDLHSYEIIPVSNSPIPTVEEVKTSLQKHLSGYLAYITK